MYYRISIFVETVKLFLVIDKKVKYQQLLVQFPRCPPDNYSEAELDAFRWVHKEVNENDYKPVSLIREPRVKYLDDSDEMCKSYGLSLFSSLEDSVKRYKYIYNSRRPATRPLFVNDIGESVVRLRIGHLDGVMSPPSFNGHITLHEYEETDLRSKGIEIKDIFDENGDFIL